MWSIVHRLLIHPRYPGRAVQATSIRGIFTLNCSEVLEGGEVKINTWQMSQLFRLLFFFLPSEAQVESAGGNMFVYLVFLQGKLCQSEIGYFSTMPSKNWPKL